MKQVKIIKIAKTKAMLQLKEGDKIFWAKADEGCYKLAKDMGENVDVLVEIVEEKGKLPLIKRLGAKEKVEVENVEVEEHPPLKEALVNSDYKELCLKLTAETLNSLQGLIDPNNVSEVIRIIYKTYKELADN